VIHHRRVIREAVIAGLVAANTAAKAQVHDHPVDPRTVFPALAVLDAGEPQTPMTLPAGPGRTIEREYRFVVQIEIKRVATYARERDDLAGDVEAAVAAMQIPGVKSIAPAGYEADLDTEGSVPCAVGRQYFVALYYTAQGRPDTPI
jgi:hypothetical protein